MRSDEEGTESWLYRKAAELGEWWRKRHRPLAATIERRWVRDRYQQSIWPLLRDHGFDKFHDCGAWRHRDRRIDVIYLRFFSKPDSMKWGVTPFSFALEAGVYFPFIPPVNPLQIKAEDGEMLPQEVDCHIRRGSIERGLKQRKNRIPNIWCVEPDGSNIEEILKDARAQLIELAVPWFGQFDNLPHVSELLTKTQRAAFRGDLELNAHGISSHTPGFLALELGQWQSAAESLQLALDSGAFSAAKFDAFSASGGDPRYRDEENRYKAKRLKGVASLEDQIRIGLSRAQSELAKQLQ
jgi:hypothetical protein